MSQYFETRKPPALIILPTFQNFLISFVTFDKNVTEMIIWVVIWSIVIVANWTKSHSIRSKCEWTRIWTIYNVDETHQYVTKSVNSRGSWYWNAHNVQSLFDLKTLPNKQSHYKLRIRLERHLKRFHSEMIQMCRF